MSYPLKDLKRIVRLAEAISEVPEDQTYVSLPDSWWVGQGQFQVAEYDSPDRATQTCQRAQWYKLSDKLIAEKINNKLSPALLTERID